MTAAGTRCMACGAALAPDQWQCPTCGRADAAGTTMGAPGLTAAGVRGAAGESRRQEAGQWPGRQQAADRPMGGWASPAPDGPAWPDPSQVLRSSPSRRTVRRATAVIVAGAAVTAALTVLNGWVFTPGHATARYFAALADRDLGAARSRLDTAATAGPLIAAATLPRDGYTPPTDAHVERVQMDDGGAGATARVSFDLGGQRVESTVRLVRSGRSFLIFPRWQVQDQYAVTVAAPSGADVLVAGVRSPANGPISAFPGAYQVGLADNPLLEADPVTAYGLPGAPSAQLQPRVKNEARVQVGKQINDLLTRCARSGDLAPVGCPFGATSEVPVTEVRWRILSKPTPTVEQSEGGVQVVTDQQGEVELTGIGEDQDGSRFPIEQTFSYSVEGPVTVQNGAVKWQLER